MKPIVRFLGTVLLILFSYISDAQYTNKNDTLIFLPKINKGDQLVSHSGYILCYNEKHEQASWVAYQLTREETTRIAERTNRFFADPYVESGSATDADYKGSGYDRGHLAPAADMGWSVISMAESFYYSNMSPQVPAFNRGIWKNLEELVRSWAVDYGSIEVVTGPVLEEHLPSIGPNEVSVPKYYYKVVLDHHPQHLQAIGFILPNQGSNIPIEKYAVTIDSVERMTGIDFFPVLKDETEQQLEKSICIPCWNWNRHATSSNLTPRSNSINGFHSNGEKDSTLNLFNRCTAITKAGNRCKRIAKSEIGLCWQHEKMSIQNQ